MDAGTASPGTNLNRMLDSLGFKDRTGDLAGVALDAAVGNNPGMIRNIVDAFTPISTSQLDRMVSTELAPSAYAEKPAANYKHHVTSYSHTHYSREQVFKGSLAGPGLDKAIGTTIEKEIMANPEVRSRWEAKFGGRIVYDGKADGTLTIARTVQHKVLTFPSNTGRVAGGMLGRIRDARMMNELLQGLAKFLQSQGPASSQTGPAKNGSEGKDDLGAILRDPSLSFEQKLAMFLFAFMEKKEKEIKAKMEAFDKKYGAKGSTETPEETGEVEHKKKKKGGGLFGGVAEKVLGGDGNLGTAVIGGLIGAPLGPVGSFAGAAILGGGEGFSQYLTIGGGLVGGYYGGPMGATAGSQIGGALGQIAGTEARGQAQKAFGVKGGSSGAAAGAAAGSAGKPEDEADSEQTEMKKLQMAVEEMNKMFSLIDNILKSMNDVVKQGPLAAIRG